MGPSCDHHGTIMGPSCDHHVDSHYSLYPHNVKVVFNGIDYGEYFDYALTSLCTSLSLPYISASSYGHTAIAECYPVIDCPKRGQ